MSSTKLAPRLTVGAHTEVQAVGGASLARPVVATTTTSLRRVLEELEDGGRLSKSV